MPSRPSPNVGEKLVPEFLIIHYTAGRSAEESIQWFERKDSRASAHLVIARDGGVTQQVPFNRVAWHAGQSRWMGQTGLNRCSLGIELDNAGRLARQGLRWRAWFGNEYDDNDVIEAFHKHETTHKSGWHAFTAKQIETALEVATLLVSKYSLKDVVGHDDISPGRKSDPGPAFPLGSFRSKVLGRKEEEAQTYITTITLNIRIGPGTENDPLRGSPLPPGTRVEVIGEQGSWRRVDVLQEVHEVMDMSGWVHHRFLKLPE